MSKKLVLNLSILVLTGLQLACGDAGFTSNQNINSKVSVNGNELVNSETTDQDTELNNVGVKPNTTVEDNTKPEDIIVEEVSIVKPEELKPTTTITDQVNPEQICREGLFSKKICTPTVKPTTPATIPIELVTSQPLAKKICVDHDGDGNGLLSGTTQACKGNKQLNREIASAVSKPHNLSSNKVFSINNLSCNDTISRMSTPTGCFERVYYTSGLFNSYAHSKGITKAGAITKFYKAGNTLNPINRTLILVGPYNPEGSTTIDNELNWLLKKSQKDNSKLNVLLNYLHKNGISVLYVSFGHVANTSLPVVEKSKALAKIITKFNKIRETHKNNPGFEKTNIMGLSLGGVVAKKALTILEGQNIDHKVNLYLSMDSPHLGAHVPLGLQYLPDALAKVFAYAKRKTQLAGVFDFIIDDLLNLDFVTDPLAYGAGMLSLASDTAANFTKQHFNNIPSNELIAFNTLALEENETLHKPEFLQMRRDTAALPSKTNKNIAIANGSITGRLLSNKNFIELRTGKRNKVELSLFFNPRGRSEILSYAWLRFPNRNQLFAGSRFYDYTYQDAVKVTEDRIPCGTTTDIIKGAEFGLNLAVSQNWNERVKVNNYHTCFIPTASALASRDGKAFKNSSFNASQSAFHEIIGGSNNTEHMFFSNEITNQIIGKLNINRKNK